jgi:hypothetical protein
MSVTYETIKSTKSGPKKYWLHQDYSTGRRRLLNNRTLRAAEQRARKIRARTQSQAQRTEPFDFSVTIFIMHITYHCLLDDLL